LCIVVVLYYLHYLMEQTQKRVRVKTGTLLLRMRKEAKEQIKKLCKEKEMLMTEYIRELIYRDSDILI